MELLALSHRCTAQLVNHDVGTTGPNFFTIDYNNVHRLPTNNADDSFLLSWFLPVTLILLLLILLVPACRLGKAWKARLAEARDKPLVKGKLERTRIHILYHSAQYFDVCLAKEDIDQVKRTRGAIRAMCMQ